jgi:hypothetical protein
VPFYALVIFIQEALLPTLRFYTSTPDEEDGAFTPLGRTIVFSIHMLPALIGSWWMLRRTGTTITSART